MWTCPRLHVRTYTHHHVLYVAPARFVDAVDDLRAAIVPQLREPHWLEGTVVTRYSLQSQSVMATLTLVTAASPVTCDT